MNAKDFLAEAVQVRREIACKLEQARVVDELEAGISYLDIVDDRDLDKVDISSQTLSAVRREILSELDGLYSQGQTLADCIDRIPDPTGRTLLTLRYVCGMRWRDVAQRMHYSVRQLQRIHAQALKTLSEHCPGESGRKN